MAPFEFHVGPAVSDFVGWLLRTYGDFFDAASRTLLSMLLTVEDILMWIPWWAMVAGVVVASWLVSRHVAGSLVLGGLLVVVVGFGLWEPTMTTLAIVVTSVILALIIGIPIGILMAEFRPVRAVMQPVLDVMQTMPSFVYLIPVMMLFQALGPVPGTLATVVYALPPVARLVDLGIRQVPADAQEAAQAFGATRWQLLFQVRLPLALPSIMAGINQTTMMALAMVVIASMVGAGGVGEAVMRAIQRVDPGAGFEAGFTIVALAIVMDRLSQGLARRWQVPRTG